MIKRLTLLAFLMGSLLAFGQPSLPIDFESGAVSFTDFDGGQATTIANPQSNGINTSANVGQMVKNVGQPWGGSQIVMGTSIDFSVNRIFKVKVFSPSVGRRLLLKVENATNGGIFFEKEDTVTTANTWEELTFDFNAIDQAQQYSKIVLIFDLGVVGDGSANFTFLFDDIQLVSGGTVTTPIDLPVTFEDTTVNYDLTDFGGNASMMTNDPTGGTNTVVRSVKTPGSQVWAGTTVGGNTGGFASAIPFTATETKMSVRVYSPSAGIPIRLKVEDDTNGAISVETEATTTMANAWETLEFDFSNPAMGTASLDLNNTYDKASIFFYFGTDGMGIGADSVYYWDDVEFVQGSGLTQIDLPVTFDDPMVDYTLVDFGGNSSALVMDPMGGSNMVARSVKTPSAQTWAGTTMGALGFANAIPFTATETKMTARVYSPAAGIPVRLKVEDATNGSISVETEVITTMANAWETLEFDFSNPAMGTAALDLNNTYDKASMFFYFGTDGASVGADSVFFWDDVEFIGAPPMTPVDLPVTFEDTTVNYDLVDFGEAASMMTMDPTGGSNTVVRSVKTPAAQTWAGTTIGGSTGGFASVIPFTATETKMTVRVYSSAAGIPVRLKVEDDANGAISVETEDTTTVANAWETLEFDFSNEAAGTAALDLNNTYDKASIFFYFGTDGMSVGADSVFFWDDVEFLSAPPLNQVDLPVTFEDPMVNYDLVDFGENASMMTMDPSGASNTVVRSVKTPAAQTWSGTTIGGTTGGFASVIPFTASETKMTVRVYSSAAGIPVRLKVEDDANGAISVETEDTTTVANAWETLEFDFSNEAAGTAALDLNNTYDKASIFFYFGTDGMSVGADSVFFWDDVEFLSAPPLNQVDLPVTFEDPMVNYDLVDFGENASMMTMDPSGASNTVVRSVKTPAAQTWSGTTIGGTTGGFASVIPFTASETKMTVRVYAPAAGIPIRLKVEEDANAAISVETEVTTTVANAWETLEFDFSNEAAGTAPLDLNAVYDKASIFFYFGTDGAGVGADSVFFWDDVEFMMPPQLAQIDLPVTFEDSTVDYTVTDFGGNSSILMMDPAGSASMVARSIKTHSAETWAGTTMGHTSGTGFANPIPFTATETKMTVSVYAPAAGIPVRLKVEDTANGNISVETEDTTTVANAWETLEFDFSNEAAGTAALDLNNTYDKASIFFHFGSDGAGVGVDSVYYWDEVRFGADTSGTDNIKDLQDLGLRYYPNPVSSQLHLEASSMIKEVRVLNLMGREILRQEIQAMQTDLDLSALPAGVYLVNLTIGNSRGTIKVVKN
jgi:hypothetical protein